MSIVNSAMSLAQGLMGGGAAAGNGSKFSSWPLAKFYFKVNLGSAGDVGFQTCDGLDSSVTSIEFRDGNSQNFFKEKRPGLVEFSPVTLKKGVFANDKALYSWYKNVSTGALFGDMRTVIIALMDETGSELMRWTLDRAYVTKFTPPSLDADGGEEVAVEELELTYQSFTMDSGGLAGAASSIMGGITGSMSLGGAVSSAASALKVKF